MKALDNKLIPKRIKLLGEEKYTRLFSTKNKDTVSIRSGCVILRENESIGEHSTEEREEVIIALRGSGELYIKGSEKLKIEEDVALYIPPGTIHDVKNTGKGILRYIYVSSPVSKERNHEQS